MGETALRAVTCDSCGRKYRYKPELAGKKVKCPCGGRVRFPAEASGEPPQVEIDLEHAAQAESGGAQTEIPESAPRPVPAIPPADSRAARSETSSSAQRVDGGKRKRLYLIGGGALLIALAAWGYLSFA